MNTGNINAHQVKAIKNGNNKHTTSFYTKYNKTTFTWSVLGVSEMSFMLRLWAGSVEKEHTYSGITKMFNCS